MSDLLKVRIKQQVSGLLNVYPNMGTTTDNIMLKVEGDRLVIVTTNHNLHLSLRNGYLVETKNGSDTILNPEFSNVSDALTLSIMNDVSVLRA